ncbi:hypothetical protein ERJ75_000681500 [Trypanosoma vivax]|uniref:Thioesterase domain-containing protein n=1 Tax=Trypanosoma vivax (strain Y486) TaxID=1055687 RepID=F9WT76_TRYVY|nr:hypothetical protein TRVL_08486 [Trypanosoma vivax]KAH8614480.1 hypothetical protein ERJ75_000681500 [Trypanosoma vivax]CCD20769.1 hypothetical protein, conserved [Trypanosoma vivax Y486]|eukprot:CCD20769.1 hypothetical protein, conserved [Trypanosoma vivax Y486]
MLTRGAAWVPVATHIPSFLNCFSSFVKDSPHNTALQNVLNYKAENTWALVRTDAKGRKTTDALAFPFTVPAALCEGQRVGLGPFTSLVDTTTSLHVAIALLPSNDMHVSVNIQANAVQPICAGDKVVLISYMDKFGKRLAFVSAQLSRYRDTSEGLTGFEGLDGEKLERLCASGETLAMGRHVKCILPSK